MLNQGNEIINTATLASLIGEWWTFRVGLQNPCLNYHTPPPPSTVSRLGPEARAAGILGQPEVGMSFPVKLWLEWDVSRGGKRFLFFHFYFMCRVWGVARELAYEDAHVYEGTSVWVYMKRLEDNWAFNPMLSPLFERGSLIGLEVSSNILDWWTSYLRLASASSMLGLCMHKIMPTIFHVESGAPTQVLMFVWLCQLPSLSLFFCKYEKYLAIQFVALPEVFIIL